MKVKLLLIGAILYVSFWVITDLIGKSREGTFSREVSTSPLVGGETTVFNKSREAFAKPLANLPTEDLRDFTFGNKMFNTKWVTAPASVTSLDGVGPTFNRMSCAACHFKDGRGRPPLNTGDPMKSMLMRLSIEGVAEDGGPMPHPVYGGQLNDNGVTGVPAEGMAKIIYQEIEGQYPDGTKYSLRKPNYEFVDMAFGPIGRDVLFSPRVAPAVHGMGLLDAIDDKTILAMSDPDDADGDGISGRPNYVWDKVKNKKSIGRYGWKANVATLKEQDASAALGDMGITNSMFPNENCPPAQKECQAAPKGDTLDMSDKQLDKMTFYVSTLAPPARRDVEDVLVKRGARLFEKAKCASCHVPQITTGKYKVSELSYQEIQPYTDLLLHDMGEGLADGRPDYEASGSEWRTPPLWGLGLVKVVNKHTTLLHDGRARNAEEAILWHGGEAEQSKQDFKNMPKEDRGALLTFLNSL